MHSAVLACSKLPASAAFVQPASGLLWARHRKNHVQPHRLAMSSASEGGEGRERRIKLRDRSERNDKGGGLTVKQMLRLDPYVNEQGYVVEPFRMTLPNKVLLAAFAVALVMAAANPPPFVPRVYLYQVSLRSQRDEDQK